MVDDPLEQAARWRDAGLGVALATVYPVFIPSQHSNSLNTRFVFVRGFSVPSAITKVVFSVLKIENGTLILVGSGDSAETLPKVFEGEGIRRHELRKVQPQKKKVQQVKEFDLFHTIL